MSRTRDIVPIADVGTRPPEAGRIRLGVKAGKAMKAITEFRFTSPHRDVLDALANLYGGTVRPWSDPKASPRNQFELLSNAPEIDVMLHPDGLSQSYELWGGQGRERNCDGVTVEVVQKVTANDYDYVPQPCICAAAGFRQCDPITRLSVVIPNIPFRGVWRLDTKSWNAQVELPGMFDLITTLAATGRLVTARLSIAQENRQTPNGVRNFVVPRLSMAQSPIEALAGAANPALAAAVSVPMAAIEAAVVVDGELIDDELDELRTELARIARRFGLPDGQFIDAVFAAADNDRDRVRTCIAKIDTGELVPLGFQSAGGINWTTRKEHP